MALTRRTLLSLPVAVPLLNLAARAAGSDPLYFPPPDSRGGWRTLEGATEIRNRTGIDTARLDEAFQYAQTTSQHGGLLVVRHGYLVYEKYFGRAHREANPNMYSIGKMFTSAACGIMLSEQRSRFPDGLAQKVFTQEYLPEAFPLSDPRMAGIQLGNLLTMTSGIQAAVSVSAGEGNCCHRRSPYRDRSWRECRAAQLGFARSSPRPVAGPGRECAPWKNVDFARRGIPVLA